MQTLISQLPHNAKFQTKSEVYFAAQGLKPRHFKWQHATFSPPEYFGFEIKILYEDSTNFHQPFSSQHCHEYSHCPLSLFSFCILGTYYVYLHTYYVLRFLFELYSPCFHIKGWSSSSWIYLFLRRKPQQPTNILHSLQRPHTFQSFPLTGNYSTTAHFRTGLPAAGFTQEETHSAAQSKHTQLLYLQNKNQQHSSKQGSNQTPCHDELDYTSHKWTEPPPH